MSKLLNTALVILTNLVFLFIGSAVGFCLWWMAINWHPICTVLALVALDFLDDYLNDQYPPKYLARLDKAKKTHKLFKKVYSRFQNGAKICNQAEKTSIRLYELTHQELDVKQYQKAVVSIRAEKENLAAKAGLYVNEMNEMIEQLRDLQKEKSTVKPKTTRTKNIYSILVTIITSTLGGYGLVYIAPSLNPLYFALFWGITIMIYTIERNNMPTKIKKEMKKIIGENDVIITKITKGTNQQDDRYEEVERLSVLTAEDVEVKMRQLMRKYEETIKGRNNQTRLTPARS